MPFCLKLTFEKTESLQFWLKKFQKKFEFQILNITNLNLTLQFNKEKETIKFVYDNLIFPEFVAKISLINKKNEKDLLNINLLKREFYTQNNPQESFTELDLMVYTIIKETKHILNQDKKKIKIIDPCSNENLLFLELIRRLESLPVNLNFRFKIPLLNYLPVKNVPNYTTPNRLRYSYYLFVSENSAFKIMKENAEALGTTLKISKKEIDWLDIKFKENEINLLITYLNQTNPNFISTMIYMIEFISQQSYILFQNKNLLELLKKEIKKYNSLKLEYYKKFGKYTLLKIKKLSLQS